MPESERSLSKTDLTIEHLLKLKRAEKPEAEFWEQFERELQQKQLQALMRPSVWMRLSRLALPPRSWPALSAVAAALALAVLALFALFSEFEMEPDDPYDHDADVMDMAKIGAEMQPGSKTEIDRTRAAPRSGGAFFVVDALYPEYPEVADYKPFRRVAYPETWVGNHDSGSYAVSTFTTQGHARATDEMRVGF